MGEFDRFDNSVWDRFFDFVSQPVESMTRKEVQAELDRYKIDVTQAVAQVKQSLAAAKARSSLEFASKRRTSLMAKLGDVVGPAISDVRDRIREMIDHRLEGSVQAAYFRKLESAASENDLKALLDDIQRLDILSEEFDALEDGSE